MASVTGKKTRYIFIEGENDESLDIQIFQKLLKPEPASSPPLLIISSGGKHGIHAFSRGFFHEKAIDAGNRIIITDRDFEAKPSPNRGCIETERQGHYRIGVPCIESYLINAKSMVNYLTSKNQNADIQLIQSSLVESAQQIKFYQATRWALQELRILLKKKAIQDKLISREWHPLEIANKLSPADGKLPTSLDKDFCIQEAHTILTGFQQVSDSISVSDFDAHFKVYLARFEAPEFWKNNNFIYWFHGKDLMTQWLKHSYIQGFNIARKRYFQWVIENHFDDISAFHDLRQLREKCHT